MENHIMTLDENPQLLDDAIRATAEALFPHNKATPDPAKKKLKL